MSRAPKTVDYVLAVAYGLLGAATFLFGEPTSSLTGGTVDVWVWLPCVVAGVVLVSMRRTPGLPSFLLAILCGVLLALNGGIYAAALLFELVLAAGIYGTRRQVTLVIGAFGVLCLLVAAAMVRAGVHWRGLADTLVVLSSLVLLAAWWGTTIRRLNVEVSREREHSRVLELAADAERETALARQALMIAEVRASLGRDMHDIIAGRLAAMSMQSAMALERLPEEGRLYELIADIHLCSATTLTQVRDLIGVLAGNAAPVERITDDPRESLRTILDSARTIGAHITLVDEIADPAEPPAPVLYVVAQELVVNMLRHTSPCVGSVRLIETDTHVVLEGVNRISETGEPSAGTQGDEAARRSGGEGLRNIGRRLAAVGGSVSHGPDADGECWHTVVRVPHWRSSVPRVRTTSGGLEA